MKQEWKIKESNLTDGSIVYSVASPKGKVEFDAYDYDGAVSMCEALNSFDKLGKGEVKE